MKRSGSVLFNPNLIVENMKRAFINVPRSTCGLGISNGRRIVRE